MFHLFFITDDLDSLGVSSNFIGGFKWDMKCTPGSMSATSIVHRLRGCLRPNDGLTKPSSQHQRLLCFFELWDGAYGTTAIQNFYLYYMPDFEDDFFTKHKLSKKQCILSLLAWGVPFVPFPVWTVFMVRQSVMRDAGFFATLRLKAARHHFYVSNCLLNDSRSILDLAIEESGDSPVIGKSAMNAFNTASSALSEYSRLSGKGSALHPLVMLLRLPAVCHHITTVLRHHAVVLRGALDVLLHQENVLLPRASVLGAAPLILALLVLQVLRVPLAAPLGLTLTVLPASVRYAC
jgi:hypothetical protein